MHPYIDFFGFKVSSYYLLVILGLLCAIILSIIRSKSKFFTTKSEDVFYAVLSAFLGAVSGAKIFQILGFIVRDGHSTEFWTIENWTRIFMGTGVFYGGLIGGSIAVLIYVRKKALIFQEVSDIMIPAVLLFNVFGRIGCYCAGCCYGIKNTFGINLFDIINSPNGESLVPVQLFEAMFNCIILILIVTIKPERKIKGILLPLYIIIHSVGRFVLEYFRGDVNRGVYILSTSQWISLCLLPVGIIW